MNDKITSDEDFENLISIAKLSLSENEKKQIQAQLSEALSAVEILNKLDTSKTEPLSHPTNLVNITRNDIVEKSLTQKEALSQSKRTHKGYFVTDRILDK